MEKDYTIKKLTGTDVQCNGCDHLKNKPNPDCHCYMFKKKMIGCKLNTMRKLKK